jgi:hypothetical protein
MTSAADTPQIATTHCNRAQGRDRDGREQRVALQFLMRVALGPVENGCKRKATA